MQSCCVPESVNSSTKARKNGATSVTRLTVWNEPRSASLMAVEGLMSTQTTRTQEGSRLPTAIECSVVAIIRQKVTPRSFSRISCCATSTSVTTSGSGPSSRMLPASR